MRKFKNVTKKVLALFAALSMALSLNMMPVAAANNTCYADNEAIASPASVVPSFGNVSVSSTYTHYSGGFGVRGSQDIQIAVNLVSGSSQNGLYAIVYPRYGGDSVGSVRFYSSGTQTVHLPAGGSYFVAFGCRDGSYVFNYTITY